MFIYFTRVQVMPPEDYSPSDNDMCPMSASNHTLPSPENVSPPPEVVSINSTLSIYEEALAETRTVVRDEAKAILKQRIREVEQLRTTLARAEEELAKLLNKTPEEIASIRTFRSDRSQEQFEMRRRLVMS